MADDNLDCTPQEDLACNAGSTGSKHDSDFLSWLNTLKNKVYELCECVVNLTPCNKPIVDIASLDDLEAHYVICVDGELARLPIDDTAAVGCTTTPQSFYINGTQQSVGSGGWVNPNESANPTNNLVNSGAGLTIPLTHDGNGDGGWQNWPFSNAGASHDGEDPINTVITSTVPNNVIAICFRYAGVDDGGITFLTTPVSQTGYSGSGINFTVDACFDTSSNKVVRWRKRNRDNAFHLILSVTYAEIINGSKRVCDDGTIVWIHPNGTEYNSAQITEV